MKHPNTIDIKALQSSFQIIGLLGKPRHDVTLQMHKNLFNGYLRKAIRCSLSAQLVNNLV